ncbi:virulence factor Mce family protein [Mycobacteroides abscessus subsp. bolletii]|uniref:MCE family protein n=1 Tax=Mycobacteroides abscessus TaxID=36809 RepID=UPI0009A6A5E7|nr:MCE family protein [Mycobacteroides abscessus]SKG72602.1 virulence factor Mce family protein [Mycobacteroides abscessus subsp. bolletii]SKH10273.1 virulence factor Mce family protein [Mycobacteroides abscessus subsp. bolletii]
MSAYTPRRTVRAVVVTVLIAVIAGAVVLLLRHTQTQSRTHVVAYFDNSNGIFAGDDVRIRGVNVGKIDSIEPQGNRVKISFWYDDRYPVPADAKAVIISPTLVTSRAMQLTPPYRSGPIMSSGATIPQNRTAVPVEWDDFRVQLEKLTQTLQPTEPGNVSTLGAFVNTAADNLRGQGPAIRDSIIKLSQALSALGDNSGDIFVSVKNLSTLVSALQDSTDIIRALNTNLAAVTGELTNSPDEVGRALQTVNDALNDVTTFVADNRDALGTTSDKLSSVSQALNDSLGDIKQLLHIGPNTLANAVNVYQPAQGTLSGAAAVNNFSDPITFLCGAIQAASRLNAEQSSKLCVQYLAPIVKNRQYNFLPIGLNPFVGATARPNEVTYSEDWLRPDFVPPQPSTGTPPTDNTPPAPLAAEAPLTAATAQPTDPGAGLPGMMLPPSEPPR